MEERMLLEQFKPFLRYDSNEGYFADSAAEMTDAPGNVLKDAAGVTIAAPGDGPDDLSLGFLGAAKGRYANGRAVSDGDVLSVQAKGILNQYRAIRAKPGYSNVVYGRVVKVAGVTWLQYWFWFFYNDLRALDLDLRVGLHEGDWEGMQLRMDGDVPDLAVYAQHEYGAARAWERVERRGQRPVVYVAHGSHASYFDDGAPLTHWHLTEHFIDRADGKVTPKGDVRLELLPQPAPGWALWPGRWGDTTKPEKGPKLYREISSGSPTGPGQKEHWADPALLLRAAEKVGRAPGVAAPPRRAAPPLPARPRLEVRQEEGRLRLDYDVAPTAGEQRPTHLLVTVNSPDDPYPPTTVRLEVEGERGTVEVPLEAEPGRGYEVRASGLTPDGALSQPEQANVPPVTAP